MKKISLLLLLYNQKGKGTYWRALGFAKALIPLGYEITILTAARPDQRPFTSETIDQVKIVATPDRLHGSGYDFWAAQQRIHWLKNQQFDLIHLFETRPINLLPALYLQKKQSIPLIFDWCDWFGKGGSVEQRPNPLLRTILRPIETFFEEKFRHHASATTVINQTLFEKTAQLTAPDTPILLLPNGVAIPQSVPDCLTARQQLNLSPKEYYLIYTGSTFASDARLMADSFNLLSQSLPNIRLILAGYYNFPIEQLLTHPEMVLRTGPLTSEKLSLYLSAADLGWLPLVNHGGNQGRFPMKLMDFMALGKPTVSTDIGDLGQLIREQKIGVAVADNSAAIAEAIINLLKNPQARHEMGKNAYHLAQTAFNWHQLTLKLDQLYQQVIKND